MLLKPCCAAYTRRLLRGLQPLCGIGVTSSIDRIFSPAAWSAVIALSRPLPGPLTRTSTSWRPIFLALSAAVRAALEKEGGLSRIYTGLRREKAVDFVMARATIAGE